MILLCLPPTGEGVSGFKVCFCSTLRAHREVLTLRSSRSYCHRPSTRVVFTIFGPRLGLETLEFSEMGHCMTSPGVCNSIRVDSRSNYCSRVRSPAISRIARNDKFDLIRALRRRLDPAPRLAPTSRNFLHHPSSSATEGGT
ncbi:hypothetical protein RRG08_036611 [Elysia crispata]|uniref:Uncharacterized protein n=1 Tax=Elysia crispata TaxID=231223 RepID=A0AAE0ZS22_9GAST|nr:hypothetical protein RRG08_036611 [Elysia crispata]